MTVRLTRRTALGAAAGALSMIAAPGGLRIARAAERPDLVVAVPGLWATHEPINATTNFGMRVLYSLYDKVIGRDWLSGPNGSGITPKPGIAESWRFVEPTVLELTIRDGARFHDGSPVTADDVAFSISAERQWGEKALVPKLKVFFNPFESVVATGPRTVRITTRHVDPALVQRLYSDVSWVVPADDYRSRGVDAFGLAPVGSGPYRFVEMRSGDYLRLEAFDDYWGGLPPARSITFRVVPEAAARVAGVVAGEFHIATAIPPDHIATVDASGVAETRSTVIENVHVQGFRTLDRPLVRDKRVRQALVHAIDRELLVEQLWGGRTYVPRGFNFPEHGAAYDAARTPRALDPALARKLLAEAGYRGEEITYAIVGGYYVNLDNAAQVMVEMWREAGANVRLRIFENWSQLKYEDVDIFNWSNDIALPDPMSPLWFTWGPTSGATTRGHWQPSEEFVTLGQKLEQGTDPAARRATFQRMVDIWEDETPAILLYRPLETYAVRKDVGWQPYAMFYMDFRSFNLAVA